MTPPVLNSFKRHVVDEVNAMEAVHLVIDHLNLASCEQPNINPILQAGAHDVINVAVRHNRPPLRVPCFGQPLPSIVVFVFSKQSGKANEVKRLFRKCFTASPITCTFQSLEECQQMGNTCSICCTLCDSKYRESGCFTSDALYFELCMLYLYQIPF